MGIYVEPIKVFNIEGITEVRIVQNRFIKYKREGKWEKVEIACRRFTKRAFYGSGMD
jgi:bisphosphoglycerate-independent phosphoglycerate mutase (AlkP superfamily)